MDDTITTMMRVNRDEGFKELFANESDRRNLLICMNCLRKSFVIQLPQHQWNAYCSTSDLCSHTVMCSHGQEAGKYKKPSCR